MVLLFRFYEKVFPLSGKDDVALLDLCSSWISHYPKDYRAGRIAGPCFLLQVAHVEDQT